MAMIHNLLSIPGCCQDEDVGVVPADLPGGRVPVWLCHLGLLCQVQLGLSVSLSVGQHKAAVEVHQDERERFVSLYLSQYEVFTKTPSCRQE